MSIAEFQSEGYLQEVNRRFLHPLGLALAVDSGWTRDDVEEALLEGEVVFNTTMVDGIMTFLQLIGLDEMHLSDVWDSRDDLEGIVFVAEPDKGFPAVDARMAANIDHLWATRGPARSAAIGQMVQPVTP